LALIRALRSNDAETLQKFVLDPHRMLGWLPVTGGALRDALHWASERTGLPVIVIAAAVLVTSWRLFKRSLRLAVEVVLAVAVLLAATRFGWIAW
jgi:hypothetical protein